MHSIDRDVDDGPGNVHQRLSYRPEIGEHALPVRVHALCEGAEEEELLYPPDPVRNGVGLGKARAEPQGKDPVSGRYECGFSLCLFFQDDLPEPLPVVDPRFREDPGKKAEKLVRTGGEGLGPQDETGNCPPCPPLRCCQCRNADAAGFLADFPAQRDIVGFACAHLQEDPAKEAYIGKEVGVQGIQGEGQIEVENRTRGKVMEEEGGVAQVPGLAGKGRGVGREVPEAEGGYGRQRFGTVGRLLPGLQPSGDRGSRFQLPAAHGGSRPVEHSSLGSRELLSCLGFGLEGDRRTMAVAKERGFNE